RSTAWQCIPFTEPIIAHHSERGCAPVEACINTSGGWCVRHASCPQRRAYGYRHGAPRHNLYPVSGFSQLIRWSGRFAQTAQLWLFTAQLGLLLADPLEGALVELGDGAWALTFGIHRCADNHLNGARAF